LTNTFYVPQSDKGNKWSVFQIRLGQVEGIMSVSDGN